MKRLLKGYELLNILSIDVSIGAVVGTLFFAKHLHAFVPLPSLVSLACTVWVIYTIDHLIDVRRLSAVASTERHRYHQKHFKSLTRWVVVLIAIDVLTLFLMPVATIKCGAILAGIVIAYVLLHKRLYVAKEFCVASLYVSGIALPVVSIKSFNGEEFLILSVYFLLSYTNLVLFSLVEKESDLNDGHQSIATLLHSRVLIFLLVFLFCITAYLCYVLFVHFNQRETSMIFVLMSTVLLLIFLAREALKKNSWYRLLGDLIFIFPALYLIG
jgi:4-hydroxybenzoate polyprenyltransferase